MLERFLGITVLSDYILSEGVDAVLDNIVSRTGATAVACNPTVTVPAPEGTGSFQPPSDAGSSPRLFDRPLFGKRGLWVRSGPSYLPNPDFYRDSPYPHRHPNDITREFGPSIGDFIHAARARGLEVYLQIGAVQPPGLRGEDIPRLPDGNIPENRMANTGSLASDGVWQYHHAYIRDLLHTYPEITGIRPDWPDYPCYKLDEAFQDFNPQVGTWAKANGYDFEKARKDAQALYHHLHGGLTNRDLERFSHPGGGNTALIHLLRDDPGIYEWLRLKAALSTHCLRRWSQVLAECSEGIDKKLSANAFMPPYSILTGFDFRRAAEVCAAVSPKLYTMHWTVIVSFWAEALLKANPGLDQSLLLRALTNLFDIQDGAETATPTIADFRYPAPDEPHPISDPPQHRKIDEVLATVDGRIPVTPIVHGYGPYDDFCRRFAVVARSRADGAWVNRYGYLSDEKLDAIGRIWRS